MARLTAFIKANWLEFAIYLVLVLTIFGLNDTFFHVDSIVFRAIVYGVGLFFAKIIAGAIHGH